MPKYDEKELKKRVHKLRVKLAYEMKAFLTFSVKRLDEKSVVIEPLVAKVMNKEFIGIVDEVLEPTNYEIYCVDEKLKMLVEI